MTKKIKESPLKSFFESFESAAKKKAANKKAAKAAKKKAAKKKAAKAAIAAKANTEENRAKWLKDFKVPMSVSPDVIAENVQSGILRRQTSNDPSFAAADNAVAARYFD